MPGALVDADVLIDALRGDTAVPERIDRAAEGLGRHLSVVTAAELRAGARGDDPAVARLLGDFRIVSLALPTAEHAGRLRREFGASHGTGLIDAILAATALEQSLTLVTNNRRHFPMPGLVLA
jgi:predicted nucleic acid-binding protein